MTEKKKILYIINPISGTGNKSKIEQLIKDENSGKTNFTIKYTEAPLHGMKIANKEKNNFDAIVAVGGDGTINEIAQSLIHSNCALGIVPLGSGNGLARHLKIPLNTGKAIKNIVNFNTSLIDTGKINNKYFVNVAGVGFDAFVAHKFAEAKGRGFKTYAHI
jgi:diacylglycerol kinase family enzyme